MNRAAYSAAHVVCASYETAMRHREQRGEPVAWFNTGEPSQTRPYFAHVGWMQSDPKEHP